MVVTPSCGPGVSNFVGGSGLCAEVVAVGGRGVNKGSDCASRVEGAVTWWNALFQCRTCVTQFPPR